MIEYCCNFITCQNKSHSSVYMKKEYFNVDSIPKPPYAYNVELNTAFSFDIALFF